LLAKIDHACACIPGKSWGVLSRIFSNVASPPTVVGGWQGVMDCECANVDACQTATPPKNAHNKLKLSKKLDLDFILRLPSPGFGIEH
jgi:hypothetical protein